MISPEGWRYYYYLPFCACSPEAMARLITCFGLQPVSQIFLPCFSCSVVRPSSFASFGLCSVFHASPSHPLSPSRGLEVGHNPHFQPLNNCFYPASFFFFPSHPSFGSASRLLSLFLVPSLICLFAFHYNDQCRPGSRHHIGGRLLRYGPYWPPEWHSGSNSTVVEFTIPLAIVVVLIGHIGNDNTAATWSVPPP